MQRFWLIIGLSMFVAGALAQGNAVAAPPPGFLHVDASAGCVFGNAPHHWFKPTGDGVFFGLVFESDEADAQPVVIEIVLTKEARQKLPEKVQKFGTFQIPVDSLLTQTQRYARFCRTNCSLLLPSRERCQKFYHNHGQEVAMGRTRPA